MKMLLPVSLIALCLALSACSGSEGGESVASTPVPIPASAPTPSASSSPALPPVSATVTATTTYSAVGVSTGNGTVASADGPIVRYTATVLQPSQITVGRDAAGGYSITLPVPTLQNGVLSNVIRKVDFSVDTKLQDEPQFFARQTAASTHGDNQLYVFGEGLKYAQFAHLLVCNTASAIDCTGDNWGFSVFAFGSLTQLAEVPASGSASYAGTFGATKDWFDSAGMNGKISLLLNFGTRAVSGSLTDVKTWFDPGAPYNAPPPVPIADFTVIGQIDPNGHLTGNVSQAEQLDAFTGIWSAGLFGTGAAEVAGVLRLQQTSNTDNVYVGTFGAAKQ